MVQLEMENGDKIDAMLHQINGPWLWWSYTTHYLCSTLHQISTPRLHARNFSMKSIF